MKRNNLRIIASSVILILIFTLLPIRGEEKLYEGVIRLHVVANSNSDTDQEMKLFVRDRILTECGQELMEKGKNASEAYEALLRNGSERIEECAHTAAADFCNSRRITVPKVNVKICRERYPLKNYQALSFPSGEYFSLQIILGEGMGENWWCVLFPPLCFAAASGGEAEKEDFISVGLSPEQYNVIAKEEEPKYRVRFKIIEWIEGLFSE